MGTRISVLDANRPARRKPKSLIALTILTCLLVCGCQKSSNGQERKVAVTNSYLECAAKDLLGLQTPVLRLTEPGMCPGHFDIRPSQINELRSCRLLLRFDFQKSMDSKLAHLTEDGLSIAEVRIAGGLCEPSSYLSACRQVADSLVAANLLQKSTSDARVARIAERLARKETWCKRRIAKAALTGKPIISSTHQAALCRWLGLEVVSTFRGADVELPKRLDQAVRAGKAAGVRLVVANLPEGRRAADVIAGYLGAEVVVFGNFPDTHNGQASFDELLAANVARLVEEAGR